MGNINRLARYENPKGLLNTTPKLKESYLDFLDRRQEGIKTNRSDDVFVADAVMQDQFSRAFQQGVLNDLSKDNVFGKKYGASAYSNKVADLRKALNKLLTLDDDLDYIFRIAIHSIIVRPSKIVVGGLRFNSGSSSATVGTIWLSLHKKLPTIDLMELLVHEFTHNVLLLDEINTRHYNYDLIARKENFARSAILRRSRPLDRVIHSIVVATELVLARDKYLGHAKPPVIHRKTTELIADTIAAIKSVRALPNLEHLITPHLNQLVGKCYVACKGRQSITA